MRDRGGWLIGSEATRWLAADAGVRRSKIRSWLSLPTADRIEAECGEKVAE